MSGIAHGVGKIQRFLTSPDNVRLFPKVVLPQWILTNGTQELLSIHPSPEIYIIIFLKHCQFSECEMEVLLNLNLHVPDFYLV